MLHLRRMNFGYSMPVNLVFFLWVLLRHEMDMLVGGERKPVRFQTYANARWVMKNSFLIASWQSVVFQDLKKSLVGEIL